MIESMNNKSVSIIITTCNRADNLKETLDSIGQIEIPDSVDVELVIVDNASTDNTAEVIKSANLPNISPKYFYEPKRGQSNARNKGMAVAKGDIFLWTDDDIRVPKDWIIKMCEPLWEGESDGVSGKIRIASYLEREWMSRTHFDRLSDTRFMGEDFGFMIGANMAFTRNVMERVGEFDPELGPGANGFADDTLYCLQMWEAGFKIKAVPTTVEHHIEKSRLLRKSWLKHGESSGKSMAYVDYHWKHEQVTFALLKLLSWRIFLQIFRFIKRSPGLEEEGCDRREIRIVQSVSFLKNFILQSKTGHKYEKRALRKR
jgi:glycosyltransferase involved in cell wall biosynthesis